jgi:succinate-semialdehyde dehydrogenase/glutarate-semialdehyde dehydrogenase/succinate-semialdehyde dehydrogenase
MSFQSFNPTNGELIGTYEEQSDADVERLLQQSFDTWKSWSLTPLSERKAFLIRLADLLEQRVDEYAALIVSEMGKPFAEAQGEVKKSAFGARHFAGDGAAYVADEAIPGTPAKIVYQSLGPIFGVMPWNLPFWQVLRFFIPAALVGNTVVVKHAESVQGSAAAIEKLVLDAGGPAGLYTNLVIDRNRAPAIISDARIAAVTVTGSTQAGRSVAQQAGSLGKKVVLELGGSDPFIVFSDADFDKAVQMAVVSRYSNNAQSCIAAKRLLVEESIAERFTAAFVEAVSKIPVGDPMSPETKLGPLARRDIRDNVQRQVDDAVKAGARILTGGKPIEGPGNFYEATVLSHLPHDAAVAREEFFGPVAMLFTFRDEDEAIALANDTEYGLGAAVWSGNAERAERVAGRIEAGAVFINDFVRSDPRAPFGGVKGSGFGRELGDLGARELTNAKLVWKGA